MKKILNFSNITMRVSFLDSKRRKLSNFVKVQSCQVIWKTEVGRYCLSEICKPSMDGTIACITYYDKSYYFNGWGMNINRITESQISWMFDSVGKKNFASNRSFAEFCINHRTSNKFREPLRRLELDRDFDLNLNFIRRKAEWI